MHFIEYFDLMYCNSKIITTFEYQIKQIEIMTTLFNKTKTKKVKITKDSTGNFRAIYVQVYNNEEQVLEFKNYTSEKLAINWGVKKLN